MAITLDGTSGITTPGLTNTGTETIVNLTTTGNTILGDASTDTLNVGNGGLVKDASGNVGIGGAATTVLDVTATGGMMRINGASGNNLIQAQTGSVGLGLWAGGNSRLYSTGALTIAVNSTLTTTAPTGYTDAVTISTTGNLGLGVTPSAWSSATAMQIGAKSALYYAVSNTNLGDNVYFNGASRYITTAAATVYSQSNGSHIWERAASGTAGNPITFTTAMTLDASGRLGIGTSSPSQLVSLNGTTYAVMDFKDGGTSKGDIGFQSDKMVLSSYSTFPLAFFTNSAERMRITSTGNVGIGTTSPQARLDLGSGYGPNGAKCLFYNDGGGELDATKVGIYMDRFSEANSVTMLFPSTVANPGRYHVAYKDTTNTTIVDVCYVGRTSTSWTFPSDERIKDIECEVTGALDILKGIRTVYYTLKRDPNKTRKIGMIAQDWLKVLPEVVEIPLVEFDFDKAEGHLALASSDTISVLVKAIQEQQTMIEELKAKVAALEAA